MERPENPSINFTKAQFIEYARYLMSSGLNRNDEFKHCNPYEPQLRQAIKTVDTHEIRQIRLLNHLLHVERGNLSIVVNSYLENKHKEEASAYAAAVEESERRVAWPEDEGDEEFEQEEQEAEREQEEREKEKDRGISIFFNVDIHKCEVLPTKDGRAVVLKGQVIESENGVYTYNGPNRSLIRMSPVVVVSAVLPQD